MAKYMCVQALQVVWVGCRQPRGWERGASTWGHKLGAQVGSTWWEYGGVQSRARHDSPRVTKGPKVSRILPVSFPGDEEENGNLIFKITQLF